MEEVRIDVRTQSPSMLQGLMGYTAFLGGISMLPRGLGSLAGLVINERKFREKIIVLL